MFVEDINLEEELSSGLMLSSTESTYRTYLRAFMEFLHLNVVEDFTQVPPDIVTDENVAKFLLFLAKKHNYKPHHKKSAIAALNKVNKI